MFDAIIVGLGAMGSAAAFHLARRGRRVLGLEQFDIPNTRGSSTGFSRMIRLCYSEHPDYVPLLRRSYELWRELGQLSGRRVFHMTGGMYLGPADGEFLSGCRRSAADHGLAHEPLTPAQVRERFPQFQLPGGFEGFWEPTAGLLLPELAVSTHAELALRAGAELHAHEPVLEWQGTGDRVEVRTPKGRYEGRRLILTVGPWAGKVIRDLKIPLQVTRQVLGWVWPRDPDLFAYGRMPVWAIDAARVEGVPPGLYYGFPMMPEVPGFKLARHVPGEPCDPDEPARDGKSSDENDFRPALRAFIPAADGPVLGLRTCLYTNSPDSNFIIDRHEEFPAVFLAAGFSGHGFKFAPVIGEVLADLAEQDRTAHRVGFLSATRFRR